MRGAQLDHLARADKQHALIGNALEDAPGQAHGSGGHRDDIGADGGARTHVLGDGKSVLKQFVERAAEGATFTGEAHGIFHLPEDLRLAEHHRIETAGDTEGMTHGIASAMHIKEGLDFPIVQAAVFGQPGTDRWR